MILLNLFMQYNTESWLLLGVLCILLEVILGFSVIFLFFTGMSCIIVAGAIKMQLILPSDLIVQFIIFLGSNSLLFACCWKPLKGLLQKSPAYSNIVGQNATIYEKDLKKGENGKVKWSGTICTSIIDDNGPDIIKVDAVTRITEIRGNVFVVTVDSKD